MRGSHYTTHLGLLYIQASGGKNLNWDIRNIEQKFQEILSATPKEPQLIYEGDRLVAAVVDSRLFQDFLTWQQQRKMSSIADTFAELRSLCAEEDYFLEIPQRQNRENSFSDPGDDVSIGHEYNQ
jgi:hypothetical protein